MQSEIGDQVERVIDYEAARQAPPPGFPALPEIPTLTEAGLPGAVITGWHGVFAPAGVPPAQLDGLEAAARKAAATPRYLDRLAHDGLEPAPSRPRAAFAAAVVQESAYWAAKVKELDLKLE